jgi:hypothetical protein
LRFIQLKTNDIDTWKRRGTCVRLHPDPEQSGFLIDEEMPILTQQREYIEDLL